MLMQNHVTWLHVHVHADSWKGGVLGGDIIGKPKGLGMASGNGSWARKTLHLSVLLVVTNTVIWLDSQRSLFLIETYIQDFHRDLQVSVAKGKKWCTVQQQIGIVTKAVQHRSTTQCFGTDSVWALFTSSYRSCFGSLMCISSSVVRRSSDQSSTQGGWVTSRSSLLSNNPRHARISLDKKKVHCKCCLFKKMLAGRVGLLRSVFSAVQAVGELWTDLQLRLGFVQ